MSEQAKTVMGMRDLKQFSFFKAKGKYCQDKSTLFDLLLSCPNKMREGQMSKKPSQNTVKTSLDLPQKPETNQLSMSIVNMSMLSV